MNSEKERLNSFWWTWSYKNRHELAKGGFYATDGIGNYQCHFCNLYMDWWTSNPISQHAIRAPSCSFVNGLRTDNEPLKKCYFEDMLTEDEMAETYDFMDSAETVPIMISPSLFTIPAVVNIPHRHILQKTEHTRKLSWPVYPVYNSIWVRFNTFKNWPSSMSQTPPTLSEAGFFYSQFNDKVTCFYCGHSLYQWERGADPWEQHALWYSKCHYVRIRRGQRFIKQVLQAEDHSPPTDKRNSSSQTTHETEASSTNDTTICKLCCTNDIDVSLIPCGHCVTCSSCIWSLEKCPVCRQEFTDAMKIYFS